MAARKADHDRRPRRSGQDHARVSSGRGVARSAGSMSGSCASPAACLHPNAMRELVKDPELNVGARAEALLYAAARAQLVDEALEPLLAAGSVDSPRSLRRFLARLPGRRAGPRDRAGRETSTASPRTVWSPTARSCWRSIRRSAAHACTLGRSRSTASSARTTVLRSDRRGIRATGGAATRADPHDRRHPAAGRSP